MDINLKNERIKRRFLSWLKEADGCCESTVTAIEKAILLYGDFTKGIDFALFNADKAVRFKKWLSQRKNKGKLLSVVTYSTYLRFLRKFFKWLSQQPGYKSRISLDTVDYLRLTDKEERIAAQSPPRNYPSLEYVKNLTQSIVVKTEIDLRDRALIAFTLLSGMRDKAIATLPLGCFDEQTLIINQNPKQGVQTKFSKNIITTLIPYDKELLEHFLEWVKVLKNKGFGTQAPLFPSSKSNQGKHNLSFETATEVEPIFWKSAGRIREIFKQRSKTAKLLYYAPHTFRHLAIDLGLRSCRTGEQIKAISQNFGHENVATTLSAYANFEPQRLSNVIQGIDFSKTQEELDPELIEAIKKFARRMK